MAGLCICNDIVSNVTLQWSHYLLHLADSGPATLTQAVTAIEGTYVAGTSWDLADMAGVLHIIHKQLGKIIVMAE